MNALFAVAILRTPGTHWRICLGSWRSRARPPIAGDRSARGVAPLIGDVGSSTYGIHDRGGTDSGCKSR